MCCKESESEERLRRQVDEMQLTVTLSDVEPDANELTEQIAALRSEVHNLTHSPFHYWYNIVTPTVNKTYLHQFTIFIYFLFWHRETLYNAQLTYYDKSFKLA